MVPRLLFQEWEGFNDGESAQQMTAASRAWPGLTLLTLADIKTAAWLVEKNHLTQLERITFTTDLDTQSVSTEVENIKRIAGTVATNSDHQILKMPVPNEGINRSTLIIDIVHCILILKKPLIVVSQVNMFICGYIFLLNIPS